jgi:hypothetical protein
MLKRKLMTDYRLPEYGILCPKSREGGLQRGQIEYQIVAVLQAIQKAPRIIPHLSIHPDSGRNRPPKTSTVQPTTIANPVGNTTVFT